MRETSGPVQVSHLIDLTSIIESSDDGIIVVDGTGVVVNCNQAAELLYGYPVSDLIGMDARVLVPLEEQPEETAILQRVAGGEKAGHHRTQRLRRDGSVVPVMLTFSPIFETAGAVVGAAIIAHQTSGGPDAGPGGDGFGRASRHRQPDDRGRGGQDARDRHFQRHIDLEFAQERVRVSQAQDRFEVILGHELAQEMIRVEQAQDQFQMRVRAERAEERVQVERAQDRFQLRMSDDRAEARLDRERLQAQLHQGQRLELLGQLAGGVAHDFNNLLAVILNYAAFVAEELAAAPESGLQSAGRDVVQIQRAAERATELTHQLLAFARREVVQPRALDLNHIVADVENLLCRTIGDDIRLSTNLAAQLWLVLADAGQIEQVLVNLAVNARDAMLDGGTLSIDTANVVIDTPVDELLHPGRHVRLRVSDTGTGMPAEVIEHAFEPFYTTKAEGAGTGLGLSTVYGIVAQAAGTVTIESRKGVGTAFTILIPVTDEAAAPVDEPLPYERTSTGETVLIVEDQEALREVTERIFTRAGYRVISAANGHEAVALATRYDGDIHLLLTDVVMPNMLGQEVADEIRRARPDMQVLFMSGYAGPVLASQGRLGPDVNLIEKPFSASAIIEKAGHILNGQFEGFGAVPPADADRPGDGGPGPDPA